ncbi:MAG: hypothetical protein QM754_18185 [Tepidisphaeraceae bacterium]
MTLPPLPADQTLVDLFTAGTLPVEELAYTSEFDDLCARLGAESQAGKHQVYARLRVLKMWGRLPDKHNDF